MEAHSKRQLSYISNPRDRPYVYETLIDVMWRKAEKFPNKIIFVQHNIDGFRKTITYGELKHRVIKLAKFLIGKGVKKGDNIGMLGPNSIEFIIAQFAFILAGAVAVNMSMSIKDGSDVLNIFLKTGCIAFFVDPGRMMQFHEAILLKSLEENSQKPSSCSNDVIKRPLILLLRALDGTLNYPTLQTALESKEPDVTLPSLYPKDVIAIFTTSGSTGKPKMVPHMHFSFVNIPISEEMQLSDRILYSDRSFAWLGGSPFMTIMLSATREYLRMHLLQ